MADTDATASKAVQPGNTTAPDTTALGRPGRAEDPPPAARSGRPHRAHQGWPR